MMESRKSMYAKIAIARKQLNMNEEIYRAMLQGEFKKQSAKDLTDRQLSDLLQMFVKLGAEFISKNQRKSEKSKKKSEAFRDDWVEITDSMAHAPQKRQIAAIWKKLGYSLNSLNERCKREFKVPYFVWINNIEHINRLLIDLQKREKNFDLKQEKLQQQAENTEETAHENS